MRHKSRLVKVHFVQIGQRKDKVQTLTRHIPYRRYMSASPGRTLGAIPFFRAQTAEDFEAAKRLFYVGVTRARRLLMYITDTSAQRNRPTRFLGPGGVGKVR